MDRHDGIDEAFDRALWPWLGLAVVPLALVLAVGLIDG